MSRPNKQTMTAATIAKSPTVRIAFSEESGHEAESGQSYEVFTFSNQGQNLVSTNYFESERAACGDYFLSWNDGGGRLLVPDNQQHTIREMSTAKHVILSSGPWNSMGQKDALELMFEDYSDAPFAITMGANQSDWALSHSDQKCRFYIGVWTRGGLQLRLPARYRKVQEIPCLAAWLER